MSDSRTGNVARGTSGAAFEAKKATEQDFRFGSGVLAEMSRQWPSFVAVSSPSAFALAKPLLAQDPPNVITPKSLLPSHLASLASEVLPGTELVVGLGGGLALDAAKSIALATGQPLVLVPAITSTGAMVHSMWANQNENGVVVGSLAQWPWCDPDYVLIDYDLILSSPTHLNSAGLGDVLCSFAGIAELISSERTLSEAELEEVDAGVEWLRSMVGDFENSLSNGSMSAETVRLIVEAIRDRPLLSLAQRFELSLGDHAFERYLEASSGRRWIHGEVTALGMVIVVWGCGQSVDEPIQWLDRSLVRWRPMDQGITREELESALTLAPTFDHTDGPYVDHSNLIARPIAGARFDELWNVLS